MKLCERLEFSKLVRKFLNLFDPSAQKAGDSLYQQGSVLSLEYDKNGSEVHSICDDGENAYSVSIEIVSPTHEPFVTCECSCDRELRCRHVYALGVALLVQMSRYRKEKKKKHELAKSGELVSRSHRAEIEEREESLATMMGDALGRALKSNEKKYCGNIETLYRTARFRGSLSAWDLRDVGVYASLNSWDRIQFWAEFPKSLRSFWFHFVNYANHTENALPEFVKPFTDTSEITEELLAFEEKRALAHWERSMDELGDPGMVWSSGAGRSIELRLRLGIDEAVLDYRIGEADRYKRLNSSVYNAISRGLSSGSYVFEPNSESELLWNAVVRALESRDFKFTYRDTAFTRCLGFLAENEVARKILKSETGDPLEVVADPPLRWRLTSSAASGSKYGLRLETAEGTPIEQPVRVIPTSSKAYWYLTPDSLRRGPVTASPLIPGQENALPDALLSSRRGLQLLYRLGVEFPEEIRDQFEIDRVKPTLRCELTRPFEKEDKEEAHIQAVGVSAVEGRDIAAYVDNGWDYAYDAGGAKSNSDARRLFVRDYTDLDLIPGAIESFGGKYASYWGRWVFRVTKKFPAQFSEWLDRIPDEINVELSEELEGLKDATIEGTLRIEVEESEIDWFDLKIVVDVGETQLSPEELKLLMDAKGDWVNLPDKGWKRLQFELSEEDDAELASLGLNPKQLTSEPQRVHALQLAQPASKKFLDEGRVTELSRRASEIQARVQPEIPKEVQCELRDYQIEGFHFLAYLTTNRFGGILADDMGLGKTLQTLAWLTWLRVTEQWTSGCALVVCPKSVVNNWVSEINRFTPLLRVQAAGSAGLKDMDKALKKVDVLVINYSVARLRAEALKGVEWAAIVLDEAQAIKNPTSQAAELARGLRSPRRLALTGTPIENRLMDLWSIMSFAMPGLLGNRSAFNRTYDGRGDPLARRRLAARVRPFLLRRTKSQVASDLPDRIEEDVLCELEGQQKTIYRAELKAAQQILLKIQTQKELDNSRFNILTSLLRLRQVCCHPKLVNETSKGKSAKLEALVDQLETIFEEGEKALVFSQFVGMLELIHEEAREREWTVFKLTGATENRGTLIESFQQHEGPAVFLISLKAGGSGLNLTAANYVFLFDPWWNPAVENQAIDRTHRIGQDSKVIAYRMLIKGTIEEKVRALQRQKSELVAEALGDEGFSSGLSLEDFRFLLSE